MSKYINMLMNLINKEQIYNVAYSVIKIIVVLILMAIIIRVGNSIINKFIKKQSESRFSLDEKRSKTLNAISKSILKYSVYFIGGFIILEVIFDKVGLTFVGIGGAAIGFGAQNLIKDIINGFFILFEDQFSVGDYVTIEDKSGIVESIEIRLTKIKDFNGDLHIIPNGLIQKITNHSRASIRISVDVDIAYEADIDEAIKVIDDTCKNFKENSKNVVDGPKVLGVTNLGDSGVTIRIIGKVKTMTQWEEEMKLRKDIKYSLDRANIEIPYPRVKIVKED